MKRIIPILMTVLLSGCSYETQVRNLSFIRTIAAETEDSGSLNVSLQLYGSDTLLSGSGETIFSAVESAESLWEKSLFSGHTELFISGKGNIRDNLILLIKNNRISPSCTFACTDSSINDVISDTSGISLADIISSSGRKGAILKRSISQVLDDMLGQDEMAAAPLISENGITMAVITPDSIAGTLDDSETQGLCWLAGDLSGIYIPVKTSEGTEDFFVRSSKTRLDAKLQGSDINITVQITINGNLQGSSNEDTQAVHKEIADRISALCADAAQKTVNDLGADVFGIEKCILSSGVVSDYNWQEIIPRLNFIYQIKIRE